MHWNFPRSVYCWKMTCLHYLIQILDVMEMMEWYDQKCPACEKSGLYVYHEKHLSSRMGLKVVKCEQAPETLQVTCSASLVVNWCICSKPPPSVSFGSETGECPRQPLFRDYTSRFLPVCVRDSPDPRSTFLYCSLNATRSMIFPWLFQTMDHTMWRFKSHSTVSKAKQIYCWKWSSYGEEVTGDYFHFSLAGLPWTL